MDVSGDLSVDSLKFCKFSSVTSANSQPVVITHCLRINPDLEWVLYVHGNQLDSHMCSALSNFPPNLDLPTLESLLAQIDRLNICCGQPDSHFVSMVNAKKGKILTGNGKVTARVDHYSNVILNGTLYSETVRTTSCELLTNFAKCTSCKDYRPNLRAMYSSWSKRRSIEELSDTSSHSNERYLNTPEKKAKMSKLRARSRDAEKQLKALQEKVKVMVENESGHVDPNFSSDLLRILHDNSEKIEKAFPEGSFANLFWKEQLKAASVKDP